MCVLNTASACFTGIVVSDSVLVLANLSEFLLYVVYCGERGIDATRAGMSPLPGGR